MEKTVGTVLEVELITEERGKQYSISKTRIPGKPIILFIKGDCLPTCPLVVTRQTRQGTGIRKIYYAKALDEVGNYSKDDILRIELNIISSETSKY